MNNTELKEALLTGQAVKHTDFLHQFSNVKVTAIIYRAKDGKLQITAELKDKSGTTYIADPQYICIDEKSCNSRQ